ncbi:FliG C-terminal domain-containing protein [uncultured Hyphomonas sp.]|uniref:FliG C-terminal domain-containing protein n=3 Tax=Hyphomonas TaxID=85 RepID=UPI0026175BA1|nr:FliG C-terminal domain-containing protein [uncultured Hyphomonas sp.]
MSSVVELKQPTQRQAVARTGPQTGSSRIAGLTRAQKAAVVIAMLGEAEARPIVERLDDQTMAQVAAALETVSKLPREQLVEIAIDFLKELRAASGSFSGGQDKAREVIANILDQKRYDQIYGTGEPQQEVVVEEVGDTWERLENYDAQQVATYFLTLTPNIIALILRRLDVAAASEIVGFLGEEQLDPVVGHLVEDEAPDPEIYSVLAHMVEIELLNNTEAGPGATEDTAHLESIGEMLSLVPSDKRDRIMAFLSSEHEGKMKSIERVMFTISSLPEILPREAVAIVFRELGEETMVQLLASLREGGSEVSDYLLSNISSRLADQYRLQLEDVGKISAEKGEKLQRQFLMSLMTLKREGAIKVGKPEEEDEAE